MYVYCMRLTLWYGIKVQDKIIVQRGERGILDTCKILKNAQGPWYKSEKSIVEFAMKNKNSNCIAWENITQERFLQETNNV